MITDDHPIGNSLVQSRNEIQSTHITPNLKTKTYSNRDVDELSNVDHIVTNASSIQCVAPMYMFEHNEAVIQMIIKGRSPMMRHVGRTHMFTLDRLCDRIKLDPKIPIKYVDTKIRLTDMLIRR